MNPVCISVNIGPQIIHKFIYELSDSDNIRYPIPNKPLAPVKYWWSIKERLSK